MGPFGRQKGPPNVDGNAWSGTGAVRLAGYG